MSLGSPLFSILQALLNSSKLDVVKDTVSYLLCIFRAIKRAQDAVNVENTRVRFFSLKIHTHFDLCALLLVTEQKIVSFIAEASYSGRYWLLFCHCSKPKWNLPIAWAHFVAIFSIQSKSC